MLGYVSDPKCAACGLRFSGPLPPVPVWSTHVLATRHKYIRGSKCRRGQFLICTCQLKLDPKYVLLKGETYLELLHVLGSVIPRYPQVILSCLRMSQKAEGLKVLYFFRVKDSTLMSQRVQSWSDPIDEKTETYTYIHITDISNKNS